MRILQVVTLISPDGEYGGPTRVALNQAEALVEAGHDVTIAAATRGYTSVPTASGRVPLKLFRAVSIPGLGFAGMSAPGMLRWALAAASSFDVVHVHLARDLVTLPLARLMLSCGRPLVVQTHGMIDPSGRALAKPLDLVFTRPVVRRADAVFHLTAHEAADLVTVAGPAVRLHLLHNGVPLPPSRPLPASPREVLFLARLQARKRPLMFVHMALTLLAEGVDASFTLVGPDEGEAPAIASAISDSAVTWEGVVAPEDASTRMGKASIYVLPSLDEPYPMSVLEAMALGIAVVVTESCGLAPLIRDSGCGIVVGSDLESLTAAVRRLLADPSAAARMGNAGRAVARNQLSMDGVLRSLLPVYESACSAVGGI